MMRSGGFRAYSFWVIETIYFYIITHTHTHIYISILSHLSNITLHKRRPFYHHDYYDIDTEPPSCIRPS